MASEERRHHEVEPGPSELAEDDRTGERVYDSFVVRLWREVGVARLLRVEVEHAQSGGVANARGVTLAWIESQIAALLAEARSPPAHRAAEDDTPISTRPRLAVSAVRSRR